MLTIALFELRSRLRLISTWVYFVLFAAIAALWIAAAGGAIPHANVVFGSDKVLINGTYALSQTVTVLGFMGVTIVAAIMGRSVQQDFEHGMFHFFYTAPIRKHEYYFGRFLGAWLTVAVIFTGIALGVFVGAHLPWLREGRAGPMDWQAVLRPYLFLQWPNQFWLGACFFTLAALTRRMLPVYAAGVIVFIGYLVAMNLMSDIQNEKISALLDPMGSAALDLQTRYWSVSDKSLRQIDFTGLLLYNRLIWCGLGVLVTAFGYWRFKLSYATSDKAERKKKGKGSAVDSSAAPPVPTDQPHEFGGSAWLGMLPSMVRLFLGETLRSVYFIMIVLAGAGFLFANAGTIGSMYGTSTYPVTYQVLGVTSGLFSLFILIITAIYAGELVWRERDTGIGIITDSLPMPSWLPFTAKLLTLFIVQALLMVVVMICSMLIQAFQGYFKFEIGHYLYELFALQLPRMWLMAVLALTLHVLINQKYAAHFAVVAFFLFNAQLPSFGLEDRLYRFASTPVVMYSDMNGYGHFIPAVRSFQAYWAGFCLLLVVLCLLFWVRGTDAAWRARLRVARQRWSAPLAGLTVAGLIGFACMGGWIYYNTHVLNTFRSSFAQEDLQARYEKAFSHLALAPQPRVTAVKTEVDLFPHQHRVTISGTQTLVNKTDQPISELYVNIPENADIDQLDSSWAATPEPAQPELDWHPLKFREPLQPGQQMELHFTLRYAAHGFTNDGADKTVVDNGTFINSGLFPSFGYQESMELSEDRTRKKHGLEPKPRDHDLDDQRYWQNNYISSDADWINFDAVVSTDDDQTALAPGYLQRDWHENGRHWFHYQMDAPILNFYAFLSARYAVKKDEWVSGDKRVPIEIYYHPGHEYNLQRMFDGAKDALTDYTQNYSPYQYRQLRILEFPRYAAFAQSFPNTIPFSESIGFIAKVKDQDPKDIDYPYYVTAHEVAHQWWAHQVIGADVQGSRLLSETLAQYSALMVMQQKFGTDKMKRFLSYELDRYLQGRGMENNVERPLYREENEGYIHYRKGSVVTYWLQDVIGKQAFDSALARLISVWGFKGHPYPTSRALLEQLKAVTPEEDQYLIPDLFEHITLYRNRALSATAKAIDGGKYEVKLHYSADKVWSDGEGKETDKPMNDIVEFGVLGADDKPLLLEKQRIGSGEGDITMVVDAKPEKAGIDPMNKLIDREPDDNLTSVTVQ